MNELLHTPTSPFIAIVLIGLPIYIFLIVYYEIQYRRAKKMVDKMLGIGKP